MNRRELLYGMVAGSILLPVKGWASMPRFDALKNQTFGRHRAVEMDDYRELYGFELPSTVEHRWGRIDVGGESVFQHLFQQGSAPICLLIHGYLDHSGLYGNVISQLLAAGWSVCAIDLPGHGLSGGNRGDISDFQVYQDVLNGVLGLLHREPTAVVGHSTGAAVLANAILDGRSFENVVLVSPLLHSDAWFLSKIGSLFVPKSMRIPRRKVVISSDPEFQRFRLSDPLYDKTMPMTWVHAMFKWADSMAMKTPNKAKIVALFGDRDSIIDQNASARIYRQLFPSADIEWYPGGNHHLLYEGEPMRSSVRAKLLSSILPGLSAS